MSDTFTKIPNYLIENMPNMKTGVFAICVAVARKTIGYQKEWDKISVKQFEELTGLSNKSVVDLVGIAVEQGWIIRRQHGMQSFEYKLNDPQKTSVETTQECTKTSVETTQGTHVETTQDKMETSVETTSKPVKKLHTQKKERNISTNVDSHRKANVTSVKSGSGKKNKRKSEMYVNPDTGYSTNDIFDAYRDVLEQREPGAVVDFGKEKAAAKRIAQAGKTPEDVRVAFSSMKAQKWYADKHLSLVNVSTNLAAILASRRTNGNGISNGNPSYLQLEQL